MSDRDDRIAHLEAQLRQNTEDLRQLQRAIVVLQLDNLHGAIRDRLRERERAEVDAMRAAKRAT